jgi:hypothetical protein
MLRGLTPMDARNLSAGRDAGEWRHCDVVKVADSGLNMATHFCALQHHAKERL